MRLMALGIALLSISALPLAGQETSQQGEDWDRRLEMLLSVPYLSLSEATVDEADTGVVFHNAQLAYEGYNLYCSRRSGDVFLLDMNGRAVHQWNCSPIAGKGIYHHAHLLDNGDLMVIKEVSKLLHLGWNSELIWEKEYKVHHDVAFLPDGSFYTITRHLRDHRGLRTSFDAIVHLTADGEVLDKWNTYDHLDELKEALDTRWFCDTILDSLKAGGSPKGGLARDVRKALGRPGNKKIDYFHLNTVSILPPTPLGERDSRFRKGNLLVCFRNVNQIAVLERDTYKILWSWGQGHLQWPHQPTLLDNGRILIFDNGVERRYSRLIELDPLAEAIVWEYTAEEPRDFYTSGGGSVQRLPNGNTLISETNSGRVFEITRDGEVVWMWLNPATWMDRRETVYRMTRLPQDMVGPLLEQRRTSE